MTAPLTGSWSGLVVSGGNLDSTTYGQGSSFPSTWNTARLFWRTDTHKLYKNSGTLSSPTWTELTLAGESITSGTVAAARIADLDTSKLTSGTLGTARGGTGGTLPITNGGTGVSSFTADKLLASNSGGTAIEFLTKPNLTEGTQVVVGSTPSGTSDGEADLGHGTSYAASLTFPTTARQFRVDEIVTRYKGLTASGVICSTLSSKAIAVTTSQTGSGSYANITFDFGEEAVFQGGQTIRYGVMCMSTNVSGHRFSTGSTTCQNSNINEYKSSFSNTINSWTGSQTLPVQIKYTPMGEF